MIQKLLVANRGEIARRIFRTCRAMGIRTVAVFSDADRSAPFVAEADEAIALGGQSPPESYLRIDAIVEAARRSGADAVHPGYGFLAENADFARAVIEAGLIWVGPSPHAIDAMGSKLASKRLAEEAGVPVLKSVQASSEIDLVAAAEEMGWPVLVKAAAGGGGKGMRIVSEPADLNAAVAASRREAEVAFGDDTVFLERYLEAPRHIEVQVFGDSHGNVVALFERECSIQRRYQKIIEEAPSPTLDDATRAAMSAAAVKVAKTVGYEGAGTVEFIYHNGNFFFLEMNTRLQVEHPVTEEITTLDLVALQLQVAAGQPLPAEALDPAMLGHAIEARLYAEDPRQGFLPATGRVELFDIDHSLVRVESGVEAGSEVSIHYDPMIGKVIAWAESREVAASLLASALARARIHGVTTNRDLLVRILRHPEFLAGSTDTHFLERHDPVALGAPLPSSAERRLAAVAAAFAAQEERRLRSTQQTTIPSGWRNSPSQLQEVAFTDEAGEITVGYRFEPRGGITVEVDGEPVEGAGLLALTPERVGLLASSHLRWFDINRVGEVHHVDGPGGYTRLVEKPRFALATAEQERGSLHAPMPGKVVTVAVTEGEEVTAGQVLVILEAMKMEHTLRSPHAGTVRSIQTTAGDQVEAGQTLVVVDP
ncbi:MAG: biotin carboxylase N-terminal domain-containing protein [Acidimicrobiia bacterium]|nr:biotin carboxylase N-terminal domain-containing protein [Acidimicrobiia bacterium]